MGAGDRPDMYHHVADGYGVSRRPVTVTERRNASTAHDTFGVAVQLPYGLLRGSPALSRESRFDGRTGLRWRQ